MGFEKHVFGIIKAIMIYSFSGKYELVGQLSGKSNNYFSSNIYFFLVNQVFPNVVLVLCFFRTLFQGSPKHFLALCRLDI